MKKVLFSLVFTIMFSNIYNCCVAQDTTSPKTVTTSPIFTPPPIAIQPSDNNESDDSLIKAKLVALAINNPQVDAADANIKIAEYNLAMAKNSWLSSISASGNINEFVINDTKIDSVPVANYYPKYNFGATIPFDIFSKTKGAKRVATENIIAAKALKEDRIRLLKEIVLTRYEDYKEKKELVRLQKISTEGDNDAYISAQKSYTDGTIQLQELNKAYQSYINSQSKSVSCEHDVNVAAIHVEGIIGEPLAQAIQEALLPKANTK